jgi:LmbE family N-acetylglucosaminyl deacetylase
MDKSIRLMVIGAHPDDCDGSCGGLAIQYSALGRAVKFVSVTDGSAGHQSIGRQALAKIRREEAKNVAAAANIEYQVLDFPDGRLEVNLGSRETILRIIRLFNPHIIITHRPNDYHPDHRYTSQIVQDASYLVRVPAVCQDTPAMTFQPAIFFMSDEFKRPYPFSPDAVVSTDDVFEQKVKMVSCHKSQYFDWLPWMDSIQNSLPDHYDVSRYAYDCMNSNDSGTADRFRNLLISRYGVAKGSSIKYAEAYELSEYGAKPSSDEWNEYFPV